MDKLCDKGDLIPNQIKRNHYPREHVETASQSFHKCKITLQTH